MREADNLLQTAEFESNRWKDNVRPTADFFYSNEGTLFERTEAVLKVASELDNTQVVANEAIAKLVGDIVDPVVQLQADGSKHVGIIEYEEFPGAYGYINFHDIRGREKRVVCAQCVHEEEYDTAVTHATAGDPAGSFDSDATYDELYNGILEHYDSAHSVIPENVETGASLASGTTIGGNKSFHAGNDGTGSGLDADTLQGNVPGFYQPGIYGDGSDGDVTDPSSIGYITNAKNFTITSGTTTTVNSSEPTSIILAQESVTINGTLDGSGAGAPGGAGGAGGSDSGTYGGEDGGNGTSGSIISLGGSGGLRSGGTTGDNPNVYPESADDGGQYGGGGGGGGVEDAESSTAFSDTTGGDGGDAGGGGSKSDTQLYNPFTPLFSSVMDGEYIVASGGGGGGAGIGDTFSGPNGGDGGGSGATLIIISPSVEINGTVDLSGEDGGDGGSASDSGGSGGGGGGGGGAAILLSNDITDSSATYDFSAGLGGAFGTADTTNGYTEGGAGADGLPGVGKIRLGR